MFTSGAGFADYVWLAARTDPEANRHKGISLFIVPTSAPGFSHRPLHTMPGVSTYYTFYDDVRVPASALVGGENDGWKLITTQLNFERAALGTLGALEPLFEKTLQWATETTLDGARVIDQPWVQLALARVEAQVAAYKLVNLRVNAAMSKGALEMGEASAAKVFGTELTQKVAGELMEILDRNGSVPDTTPRCAVPSISRCGQRCSTRSAAAPTRSNAPSSPWLASACRANPVPPRPDDPKGLPPWTSRSARTRSPSAEIARDLFERLRHPRTPRPNSRPPTPAHDPAVWKALADADLLGIALPESVGGSGRGFLDLAILLAEVGWSVAPVPAYATLVLGADTIARHGDAEQIRATSATSSRVTASSPRG